MKKIPLKIVTNRNLCPDMEFRLKYVFEEYKKNEILQPYKIDSVILREKDMSYFEYKELYRRIEKICKKNNVNLYVNNFYKLALEENFKHIHLPYTVFDRILKNGEFKYIREITEVIGVSVHNKEEALLAQKKGADYVIYGHIYNTDCKRNIKARGINSLKEIIDAVMIDVFAIGGIDESRAKEIMNIGAKGVCMMSGIFK